MYVNVFVIKRLNFDKTIFACKKIINASTEKFICPISRKRKKFVKKMKRNIFFFKLR